MRGGKAWSMEQDYRMLDTNGNVIGSVRANSLKEADRLAFGEFGRTVIDYADPNTLIVEAID